MNALHAAANDNDPQAIASLLDEGADIEQTDPDGATPLLRAAIKGNLLATIILIERGAILDVPVGPFTLFDCILQNGNPDIVSIFLTHLPNPPLTTDGMHPIHTATFFGHCHLIEVLVECGQQIDCTDAYGNTPIHYAARSGKQDIVLTLATLGADLGATNIRGETPLDHLEITAARIRQEGLLDVYWALRGEGAPKGSYSGLRPLEAEDSSGFFAVMQVLANL